MKRVLAALAALVVVAGCAIPPADRTEPVQIDPGPVGVSSSEEDYLRDLFAWIGIEDPGDRAAHDTMLDTGYTVCSAFDMGISKEALLAELNASIDDRHLVTGTINIATNRLCPEHKM